METDQANGSAREVLEAHRQAAIEQSVEAMARLYADDAVHEFPFTRPGLPARLEGREQILQFNTVAWANPSLNYERYNTLAIHDTADPNTIVVEQEAIGRDANNRAFSLPNIVVLTVRDGQITHFRDYVNLVAVEQVLGATRV